MKAMASRQRGVSFSGLLVWVILLIFVAIGAMKLIPAYVENAKINKIFSTIANDPEMQTATPKAVRESYSKRTQIDNVTVIDPNDIDIVKDASGLSRRHFSEVEVVRWSPLNYQGKSEPWPR